MGNPATLRPKPFTSEYQPVKSGRKKGVPNRATVYKELLKLKTKIKTPEGETKHVSLYEAAALGQLKSAMKGNTPAWKEIQDTLHGKIADRIEIDNTSVARDALIKLVNSIHGKAATGEDVKLLSYAHPAVYELPEDKQAEVVAEVCRELGVIELVENEAGEFEAE